MPASPLLLPITRETLVEQILDLPGVMSYCIRRGVSPYTCSGDFPCSIGRLLEIKGVADPEAFLAGLNELAEQAQAQGKGATE